ncbi:MAG: DUF2231 domain-containing protein, partial [Ferruginibacter sp.]
MITKKFKYSFPHKKKFIIAFIIFLTGSVSMCLSAQSITQSVANKPAETESFWLWNFLGRLHPGMVHFPVGLILIAAIFELFTLKNFNSKLRPGINLLVIAGALSAVVSAVLGLLLARNGDYGKNILAIHQWAGIATACLGGLAVFFLLRIRSRKLPGLLKTYRGILFFTAVGVSVAGHFGGSLTHGSDYLSETFPWSEDYKPV